MKINLKSIDGEMLDNWSTECTLLAMTEVTLERKVMQSLAYGLAIVKPGYFDAVIQGVHENETKGVREIGMLTYVKDFLPSIVGIGDSKMMEF